MSSLNFSAALRFLATDHHSLEELFKDRLHRLSPDQGPTRQQAHPQQPPHATINQPNNPVEFCNRHAEPGPRSCLCRARRLSSERVFSAAAADIAAGVPSGNACVGFCHFKCGGRGYDYRKWKLLYHNGCDDQQSAAEGCGRVGDWVELVFAGSGR